MRIGLICLVIIFFSSSYAAADNKITFYRDGALIQQEASAVKGMINFPLPADLLEQTLTITPAAGTKLLNVEMQKGEPGSRPGKELETLVEQRRRLEDRLQALETREAIFTAAAKAQSGKAPRRTKANPNPMQTIRQGTDFAIAQLEAVYTARRWTTQEIRKIDTRLATAGKSSRPAGSSVKIIVSPPRGRVTLRYATSERGWQPHYNLHIADDGSSRLEFSARLTGNGRGNQVRVSPDRLNEGNTAATFALQSSGALLAAYILPITEEHRPEGIFNSFSGTVTNNSGHYLPAGESGLFRSGTYLGKFRFEGMSSGRSNTLTMGM